MTLLVVSTAITGSPSAWRMRDARFIAGSPGRGPGQAQGERAALGGDAPVQLQPAPVPGGELAADVEPQARARRAGPRPLAADEQLEDPLLEPGPDAEPVV